MCLEQKKQRAEGPYSYKEKRESKALISKRMGVDKHQNVNPTFSIVELDNGNT